MNKIEHNYLWYLLTNFIEIENKKIFFTIPKQISPYIELNIESMNAFLDEDLEIEVNPLLRFENIFAGITKPDAREETQQLRKFLANLIFHYLGKIDLYTGQNKKDIIVKEIVRNIKKGCYGGANSELYKSFKEFEKYIVADIICAMYGQLGMIDAFKKAIKLIFKDSIVYDKLSSNTNLVLYLNYPETEDNENKVKFMQEIFLPLGLELDIFWVNHFGVIGVDRTLLIGQIAVF